MICGILAAKASAPRLTCTMTGTCMGCFMTQVSSGSRLPSSRRGFFASGSSSSSSSRAMGMLLGGSMPGGLMPGGMAPICGGAASDACGSLALMVETPVMGPAPRAAIELCGSIGVPDGPDGRAPIVFFAGSGNAIVGGTMVCAGPASAPASRAAASAPASAASLISSSTVPNKSGLFATKLAKLASTSSAKADSFLARSTRASF
mmetsp:Transcript_24360/g.39038  ORF Transcript_24360/g.39038 Transcript_24360/m.39038 type:complete len:205 (-) Transcript_24360:1352-1966(-)